MFEIIIIIIILILILIGYISTDPEKLNTYKSDAEKRFYWERSGYFYDWAPNLKIDKRPPKTLAPTPTSTPTPTPTPTPCLCTTATPTPTTTPQDGTTMTPCICPTPSKTTPTTTPSVSKISDCKSFLTAIGGLNGIVGCRNVLHAKCRDNKQYKPVNAAEQKCADIIAKYSGNICNCMTQIHQVCLGGGHK